MQKLEKQVTNEGYWRPKNAEARKTGHQSALLAPEKCRN
jgi:hypothetical protein